MTLLCQTAAQCRIMCKNLAYISVKSHLVQGFEACSIIVGAVESIKLLPLRNAKEVKEIHHTDDCCVWSNEHFMGFALSVEACEVDSVDAQAYSGEYRGERI